MNEQDKAAFEAAEKIMSCDKFSAGWKAALDYARSQPAQEPVAWRVAYKEKGGFSNFITGRLNREEIQRYEQNGHKVEFAFLGAPPPPATAAAVNEQTQPAQEPIYIVGKGWQCDEMPPVGTRLYTAPPAAAVNEQMLNALKMVMDDPESLEGRPRTFECVVEAIAAAEKARGRG